MNSNLSAILSLHAELSLVLILLVALLADLFMGRHRQRWFHPVICVLMALQIGLNPVSYTHLTLPTKLEV